MEIYRISLLVQKSINIELGKNRSHPMTIMGFLIIILKDSLMEVVS